MTEPQAAARRRQRLFWNVFVQNLLNNYGYFAPLAVLGLYLLRLGFTPPEVGSLLLFLSICGRASRALFAPLLDRVPLRAALTGAYLVMGAGYFLVASTHRFVWLALGLFCVGTAYGSCSLLLRTLVIRLREDESLQLLLAKLTIGTNVAATLGPLISNLLYSYVSPELPFVVTGAVMVLTGLLCYGVLGAMLPSLERSSGWWKALFDSVLQPDIRLVLVATACTWFGLAQIFSFAPIALGHGLGRASIVWTLFSLNAVLVIGLSVPLTAALERHGMGQVRMLSLSAALLAACFTVLAIAVNVVTLYAAVVLLTLVEIVALPALSVLLVTNKPARDHMVLLGVNAIAIGIGEAGGNFAGAVLGNPSPYTPAAFACIALSYAVMALALPRARAARALQR